jgi:hypothetical protein
MLAHNIFIVTGKQLANARRALTQIEALVPGDVLFLHHNAGDITSGIKAITVVRIGASAPVPVNASVTPVDYIRTVEVEPWIVLDEVLTHPEIEKESAGRLLRFRGPFPGLKGTLLPRLVDLFFAKMARQFNAKSVG